MKTLLLPAALLLAATAHAQTTQSNGTAMGQSAKNLIAAAANKNTPQPQVDAKLKSTWLSEASSLTPRISALQSNPLSKQESIVYVRLATMLGMTSGDYPAPATTPASTLRPQLMQWVADVKAGKYDSRFTR